MQTPAGSSGQHPAQGAHGGFLVNCAPPALLHVGREHLGAAVTHDHSVGGAVLSQSANTGARSHPSLPGLHAGQWRHTVTLVPARGHPCRPGRHGASPRPDRGLCRPRPSPVGVSPRGVCGVRAPRASREFFPRKMCSSVSAPAGFCNLVLKTSSLGEKRSVRVCKEMRSRVMSNDTTL